MQVFGPPSAISWKPCQETGGDSLGPEAEYGATTWPPLDRPGPRSPCVLRLVGGPRASKYSMDALSDALRLEVAPWSALSRADRTRTAYSFIDRAVASIPADAADGDRHHDVKDALTGSFTEFCAGPISRFVATLDDIANVVTLAATARHPRTRHLINFPAAAQP